MIYKNDMRIGQRGENMTDTTLIETRYALGKVTEYIEEVTEHIEELEIILNKIYQTMFSVSEVKALLWCQSIGWGTSEGGITANTDLTPYGTTVMLRKAFGCGLIPSKGILKQEE